MVFSLTILNSIELKMQPLILDVICITIKSVYPTPPLNSKGISWPDYFISVFHLSPCLSPFLSPVLSALETECSCSRQFLCPTKVLTERGIFIAGSSLRYHSQQLIEACLFQIGLCLWIVLHK